MSNETMEAYTIIVNENSQGKKCLVYPDYKYGNITLKGNIIKRITTHNANLHAAVIDAIASIIKQDKKIGVNKIGAILRVTCKIAINNACLSAGVKGVKEGKSNKLVAEAMADALLEVATKKASSKKATEKATEKNAAAGADDIAEIKNEAVLTAVQLAEKKLKARLASKLSELVESSRKEKSINLLIDELMSLISYLRATDDIIECKLDNIKAVKASKAKKAVAKKTK